MIHWTPEGCSLNVGLNIYINKRYFRVIWCWYKTYKHEMVYYYFRFRWLVGNEIAIKFFFEKDHWNVISSYLKSNNFHIVSHEVITDLANSHRMRMGFKKLDGKQIIDNYCYNIDAENNSRPN